MNVHEFLNTYLGGNKNISTLTYYALAEMLADYAKALQLQQTGVMACFSEEQLSQINKYGKHQHNRGAMDLSYVSFEFWLK